MASSIRKPDHRHMAEIRRRLPVRPEYIVLAIILALFAWKFVQKMQEVRQLQGQENALQISNNQTHHQNVQLRRDIHYYRTPQYVEQEARAVLGYTMPGDVSVLTRPHHEPVVSFRSAPRKPHTPPQPSWKQWWQAMVH